MTNITDEMIRDGAAILDPMLSSDCPKRVARDVYEAMEEAKGAKFDASEAFRRLKPSQVNWHRIAEICLPRPEDGHVLRMRADGTVEGVPHPAVNRTDEAGGPNIPTAATKLRPAFRPDFEV